MDNKEAVIFFLGSFGSLRVPWFCSGGRGMGTLFDNQGLSNVRTPTLNACARPKHRLWSQSDSKQSVARQISRPSTFRSKMRGILVKRLAAGVFQCATCGLRPPAELHTAQGAFWWVPGPHNAPCGQPCIGGGLEAPFQGHRGDGNCTDSECEVESPKKIKHYEKAQLPTWAFEILLPILISSKE